MNSNVVSQLIRGSEEIDRMKKEISSLIGIVCGLAADNPGRQKPVVVQKPFQFDSVTWFVSFLDSVDPGRRIFVEITVHDRFYSVRDLKNLPLQDVQVVHDSLPTFLAGMLTLFPRLSRDWKPFLHASRTVKK